MWSGWIKDEWMVCHAIIIGKGCQFQRKVLCVSISEKVCVCGKKDFSAKNKIKVKTP